MSVPKFRWGLAVWGGVLTEIGLVIVLVGSIPFGPEAALYIIPPASLFVTAAVALWVARKAGAYFLWHGLLVGGVAAAIYLVMSIGQSLPLAYVSTHFLKLVGGLAGGRIARRHRFHQTAKGGPLSSSV